MNLLPLLLLLLLLWALYKKVPVFTAFLEGAANSLPLLGKILPSMGVMLVAICILRDSGALEAFSALVSPLCEKVGLDPALVPLLLLRPLSGSGASAALADLYARYGADSLTGYLGGILMGSTETIFYTLGVYFGGTGITHSRYALPAALLVTLTASLAGIFFGTLLYSPLP